MGEISLSAGMLPQENVAPTSISISTCFSIFNVSKRKEEKIKFPNSFLKLTQDAVVANIFLTRYCKKSSVNPRQQSILRLLNDRNKKNI